MLILMLQGQIVFFAKEHISSVFHTFSGPELKRLSTANAALLKAKPAPRSSCCQSLYKEKDYAAETNGNTNAA